MITDARWLPDFAANQRLLLAWPYRTDVWRNRAEPAQQALLKLLRQLPDTESVSLVVSPHVSANLPNSLQHIHRIEIDYDDIWLRDIAPLWQERDKGVVGLSFVFNGWGGVQQEIAADKRFAEELEAYFNFDVEKSRLVAEGGAFTQNGKGDWLIGLACLKQRNPHLSVSQLKALLHQLFSGQRLYFFDDYLTADETGGHIDNMALFITPTTLLYVATDDTTHPDYKTCQRLKALVAELPNSINAIPLPLPFPQSATPDERQNIDLSELSLQRTVELPLLCSYVNVLQASEFVIVPQFGLATDDEALQVIRAALPMHHVTKFDAREFVLGGGGLHCISHNLPVPLATLVGTSR